MCFIRLSGLNPVTDCGSGKSRGCFMKTNDQRNTDGAGLILSGSFRHRSGTDDTFRF